METRRMITLRVLRTARDELRRDPWLRNRRKDWRKWSARRMEQARDIGSRILLGLHVATGVQSRLLMRAYRRTIPDQTRIIGAQQRRMYPGGADVRG